MDDAGRLRGGGVGVYRGEALVHMAPTASRVPTLIQDLLDWLARGELHPLVASWVFHYLRPALDGGWIAMTQPDSPSSPTQRYRLASKSS